MSKNNQSRERDQQNFPLYKPSILTITTDLAVREKIHATVLAHKGRSIVVANAIDFDRAVDGYYPILILLDLAIDMGTVQEWVTLIRRCKLQPHTRAIIIVAFGESKADLLRAEEAGADLLLSPDELWPKLNQIVSEQIHPPIQYLEGWDDLLPADARKGLEEFNCKEYFEQHELLEAAWVAELRPIRNLYQGILQTGVALLQIERNNWSGAIKLFRRGLPKLRALPPQCQGIELADFRTEMEQIHAEVTGLGQNKLADFDQNRFPKIKFD